jgi:hypothetical protein
MTDVYEKLKVKLPEEKAITLPKIIDDLTKIKGIGSGTAEKLNVRKIYTYRQLAEITPEKLSEAPGIGITTARNIIEEAKNLLGGFQEQNSVDKQNQVIKKEPETLGKVKETGVDNIETFEVAEVIVEEELGQEKLLREEESSEPIQEKWFIDKFNRSRLTASYPPISKRSSKESNVEIEEIETKAKTKSKVENDFESREDILQRDSTPYSQLLTRKNDETETAILEPEEIETETKIEPVIYDVDEEEEEQEEEIENYEKYEEVVPEQFEKSETVEPFESEVPLPKEEVPREKYFVTPTYTEFSEDTEVTEIPEIPEIPIIPEAPRVPARSRVPNRREKLKNDIAATLKNLGYYAIPSAIEGLRPFLQNVDYIGCKLVRVNDNSKLIFLVPIKLCDLEGRILIHEEKIDYMTYSKAQGLGSMHTARHYIDELLKAKDSIFEDVINGNNFRRFFQKYLQIRFTTEKSANNKKLYFVSGQTQYKVLIEPILLTKIPAKSMEKSILFPYQRKTNLHVIDKSNIAHLLQFLEKKCQLIESLTKKTNSIELYQNIDAKFRSSLKMASLPFLGYSVILLAIYFSQLYFLLRLFNSIGFAVIGIYFFAVAYFYFKFSKTKKELKTEFKTPYYLQNRQFSETDLLCVKEEFTDEQMAQFGYECFGKDNDFKVLEQLEKDTVKESVVARQQEQNIPQLYELDSRANSNLTREKAKREVKYSSFLDD